MARGRGGAGKLGYRRPHSRQSASTPLFQRVRAVPEACQSPPTAPPPQLADRIAGWIVCHRRSLALLGLVLVAASVERARHLEFSRSIDAMFDRADPALVPYALMTRTFGGSEVVLAAYDDAELFTPAGIARLGELTATLRALPGVAAATSLATTPLGRRIIATDTSPSARRIVSLMEGYVVGADHRTAAVACTLDPPAFCCSWALPPRTPNIRSV